MLDPLIDQAARSRGIGDAYHDYRGELVTIGRESKKAILAAMGCPVDDATALAAALAADQRSRWQEVVPPIVVLHPARRSIDLAVVEDSLGSSLQWRANCADGASRQGQARLSDLEVVDRIEVDGRLLTRRRLWLPDDLPHGHHRLHVQIGNDAAHQTALIVAPQSCFEPQVLREGRRLWGVAVQLYTLRSGRNWGIGDFADLEAVVRAVAPGGAAFVGINPLHALFPSNPGHFSPYSASSRHFLNVLYVAVEQLPEFAECVEARAAVQAPDFQGELRRLRETVHVDYPGVARAKLGVLELLHAHFQRVHVAQQSERARRFEAFRNERGETLRLQALHDALDEHMRAGGPQFWGWPAWPEEFRQPGAAGVAAFEATHRPRVDYYAWLQWVADQQLRAVQQAARELGMPIGLYGDYAVGVDSSGAETWSDQALYRKGAGVGAPPDALALKGQDWGIPPQDPNVLRAERYEPFRNLLAASMRNFGALRLDHVMALYRQWWVPVGSESTRGGYVHYPVDDLMSVLALESELHHCLVVGEDLGTVPPEVSHAMGERCVYSYRVLLFEKHGDGRFKTPQEYPRRAIATVTTHDLPTLLGFWSGSDIDLRQRLALYPSDDVYHRVRQERQYDRESLVWSLECQGLKPDGFHAGSPFDQALAHAVQVYLARSHSALVVLQAEDLAGMADPVNVPGTNDEHANWQRKMSADLDEVLRREHVQRLFRDVQSARAG